MSIPSVTRGLILASVIVVWITTAGVQTAGQSAQNGGPSEEVTPVPLLQPGANEDEIFAQLVKQNELRNAPLQEYSAVGIYAVTMR